MVGSGDPALPSGPGVAAVDSRGFDTVRTAAWVPEILAEPLLTPGVISVPAVSVFVCELFWDGLFRICHVGFRSFRTRPSDMSLLDL